MKKNICILLAVLTCLLFSGCSNSDSIDDKAGLQLTQMRAICELATMKCYYHNVAKYYEKDATGVWLWKKDRKFWIEYSGVVTIGIDAQSVHIEIENDNVTITIPPAKVIGCKVDEETLTEDSFIIAKNSAEVTAEHQIKVFQEAQTNMRKTAENDTALLANAQQRAQELLEDYINNIGNCIGKKYNIKWVYAESVNDDDNTSMENN